MGKKWIIFSHTWQEVENIKKINTVVVGRVPYLVLNVLSMYCHVEGGVGSGTGRAASPPGAPGERRSSGSGAGSTGRLTEDTLAYTVRGSDTLTSLAARFDTTPSELVAINKLSSRLIFPGQVYICI